MAENTAKSIPVKLFLNMMRERSKVGHQQFCFILGAGASFTSGIPLGTQLMREWLKELQEEGEECLKGRIDLLWSKKSEDEREQKLKFYLDPDCKDKLTSEDYFDLYDVRFIGQQSVGLARLEKIMEKASPSCGYGLLAMMLTNTKNNLVITTNFDSLVEDAAYTYCSTHPMVISHESLAPFLSHIPERPVVAKMHRGLFFDPLNRRDELTTPAEEWKEPILAAFKKYIPVVIGYAGGDKTLMQLLEKADLPENGLYWCHMPNESLSERIRTLVAQKNGFLVEIQGFDELMLQMGTAFQLTDNILDPSEIIRENQEQQLNRYNMTLVNAKKKIDAESQKKLKESANQTEEEIAQKEDDNKDRARKIAQRAFREYIAEEYEEAAESYKQAIELDPSDASYHYWRGDVLDKLGHPEEALEAYDTAIGLDPNNASYHFWRGAVLDKLGHPEEALEAFDTAIRLDPNNASYHLLRGAVLHKLGHPEEALEAYDKAIELDSDNSVYFRLRANILRALGRDDEAAAAEARAAELEKDKP